jgi:CheY-like chemotaxis protein
MLNTAIIDASSARAAQQVVPPTTQTLLIVNGSPTILALLETILDAGHYDVVFVESNDHAYSQIKRVRPDLIILCVRIDESDGLQVLSMLKLDEDTRSIPVLTYATEYEGEGSEEDGTSEPSDTEMFIPRRAEVMN